MEEKIKAQDKPSLLSDEEIISELRKHNLSILSEAYQLGYNQASIFYEAKIKEIKRETAKEIFEEIEKHKLPPCKYCSYEYRLDDDFVQALRDRYED